MAAAILFVASMPAHAHGIYTGLHNSSGTLCCGDNDCGPVLPADFKHGPDGTMFVRRHGGTWYEVKPQYVLPVPSPDGFVHACIWGGEAWCILLPQIN